MHNFYTQYKSSLKVTESILSYVSNPSSSRQVQKNVGTRLEIGFAGRQLLMVVGIGYLLYIVSDEYNINAADSELIDD